MSRNRRRAAPAVRPKDVNGLFNTRTLFYKEQLGIIVRGLFEIECPDDWDRDYMLDLLLFEGHFVITDSIAGVLPFRNTFRGVNYMNMPTGVLIAVPTMPEMQRVLNKDCVLIYLKRNRDGYGFYTFNSMLDIFAERLASADACIDVNLMNSRVAYIVEAETKAQAETLKEAYARVTDGEPLVVLRKGASGTASLTANGMNVFFNSVKQNYIADVVQDSKRSIMNEFLTMLGINNANTDKKERLIVGEVDSNNDELACNTAHFENILKQQVEWVKKIFPGLKFDIKFKFNALNEEMERMKDAITSGAGPMGVSSSKR